MNDQTQFEDLEEVQGSHITEFTCPNYDEMDGSA